MEKDQDEIHVTITGKNSIAREFATGLVATAFNQGGFTNVATLNPAAEAVVYPEVSSMYDLVQAHAPHLLKAPVKIQGSFADFKDLNAKGAFGPVPVGDFTFEKGEIFQVEDYGDNDKARKEDEVFTLYVSEKDNERLQALQKEEADLRKAVEEANAKRLEELAKRPPLTRERRLAEAHRLIAEMSPLYRS